MTPEELKILYQTVGQAMLGLIAFYLYHKFNSELLKQNADQHERQHEQQAVSRKNNEDFIERMFALIIKQQRDYEDLLQTSLKAEEEKHRFFRLAMDTFEKIGACQHGSNGLAGGIAQKRGNSEAQDGNSDGKDRDTAGA